MENSRNLKAISVLVYVFIVSSYFIKEQESDRRERLRRIFETGLGKFVGGEQIRFAKFLQFYLVQFHCEWFFMLEQNFVDLKKIDRGLFRQNFHKFHEK